MAVAYRSHFEEASGSPRTGFTLTEPSGAAAGDILIAAIYIEGAPTVTPPSGWSDTFGGTVLSGATADHTIHMYWIRRGGSAPALNWSWGSSIFSQGAIVAYSGAETSGNPFSFGGVEVRNDSTASTWPSDSGTTSRANEMLIWCGLNYNGGTSSVPPTGFTERMEISSDDIAWADLVQASAGATGSITGASWTGSGNGTATTVLMGLMPPSSSTTEQEGFRFRNDDGSETTATWVDAQDTNVTAPLSTNLRLRTLINGTGDPASTAYTLYHKKSTDSVYKAVPTTATTSVPTWVANGTNAINAAAITPALPAGIAVGDVLVAFFETANQAISIANGNGATWTEIDTQTGTGTGGSTSATRLAMYWTLYDGVITTGPTTNDSGDHQQGFIAAFRGCDQTSPINVTATMTTEAGPTTANIPGTTTTVNNCLVVIAIADDWDNSSTTRYTSWTNSNLTSINERRDAGSPTQNGGGLGMATGTLATAGNYGTSTVAINASILANANGSFALAPAGIPIYVSASSNITAGGEATTAQLTAPSGKSTSDFVTGRMWDNENGSDAIDITSDDYTELEWSLVAQSPAVDTDTYTFRVYAASAPLDTYTVTPQWTIGTPAGNQLVTPTTASLTLTTFAPAVTVSNNKQVVPTTASLTTTTFAPSVIIGNIVVPTTVSLTLTTFAPAVSASDNKQVIPGTASLTLTAFAPSVTATANQVVVPSTASLTLTTFAPTVTATANRVAEPATASLTLTTFAPSVTVSNASTVVPGTASLSLTTFAPAVAVSANQVVIPGTAALVLTTFAPTVTSGAVSSAPRSRLLMGVGI